MFRALILAALAGVAAFYLLPMLLQVAQRIYQALRHPQKAEQLSRVSVAVMELCHRKPDITQAPEFSQAIGCLIEQLHREAREAAYPLHNREAVDAVLFGILKSDTVPVGRLLELEQRILASLPAAG
jgi:hypothetical protein